MRAINYSGSGLVTEKGELLLLESAFRGGGRSCADVRRWPGEYEANSNVGTSEY
jgi:hypothetical protein